MQTPGFVSVFDESGVISIVARITGKELRLSQRAMYVLLGWLEGNESERSGIAEQHPEFFRKLSDLGFLTEADSETRLPDWQKRWGPLVGSAVTASQNTGYTSRAESYRAAVEALTEGERRIPSARADAAEYTELEIQLPNIAEFDEDEAEGQLLRRRRTCRDFLDQGISAALAGELLTRSFGIECTLHPEVGSPLPVKVFPSGGSRHELWPLLYVNRVSGWKSGFYRYLDHKNSLVACGKDLASTEQDQLLFGQTYLRRSALTLFLIADLSHYSWKYRGLNAVNTVWANAGSAAAMASVVAEILGLGSVITPAVNLTLLTQYIQLTEDEICTLALSIGLPDRQACDMRLSSLKTGYHV
ncbi:MAG: nitroreductase family protein [Flaviflexus sp.]|nr:nitroreductase family protein [Flaviflexus sp.]